MKFPVESLTKLFQYRPANTLRILRSVILESWLRHKMNTHDIGSGCHNSPLGNQLRRRRTTDGRWEACVRSAHGLHAPARLRRVCATVRRGSSSPRLLVSRSVSLQDQFLCLAFAQLTFRESLRNIETCLRSLQPKLYHAGFRGFAISRSLAGRPASPRSAGPTTPFTSRGESPIINGSSNTGETVSRSGGSRFSTRIWSATWRHRHGA